MMYGDGDSNTKCGHPQFSLARFIFWHGFVYLTSMKKVKGHLKRKGSGMFTHGCNMIKHLVQSEGEATNNETRAPALSIFKMLAQNSLMNA